MSLHGSPIWVESRTAHNIALLRSQRAMAIGVVHGYTAVASEAADVLSGSPLPGLEAETLATVYEWCRSLRFRGENPCAGQVEAWRLHAQEQLRGR